MKRVLTLVVVLAMMLCVLPMALAEDTVNLTCEHANWAAEPNSGYTEPTCTEAGVKVYACLSTQEDGTTPCTGTKTVTTPATGHTFVEGVCACGEKEVVVYTATAETSMALKVGESKSMGLTLKDADGNTYSGTAKVSYGSDNTDVATVSEAGTVTAVTKGTAKITATITEPTGVASVECVVVVSDGAVITCDSKETAGNSATLTPVLEVNGKTVNATFDFAIEGGKTYTDKSALTIDRDDYEVVKVTISVNSYIGTDDQAGDVSIVEDVVAYVSFYETMTAEATVRNGVLGFMFDDDNVFSSVKIDGVPRSNPSGYSMTNLWASNADWYNITIRQSSPTSKVASITYPSSVHQAFDPYTSNDYSLMNLKNLKFNCLSEGSFKFSYEQYDRTTDLKVQEGTITINVKEGAASIEYTTSYDKELKLDEDDFVDYWVDLGNKSADISHVVFDDKPDFGALYVDDSLKKVVNYGVDKFYFSGKDVKLLDDVVYVPENIKANYDVTIPFTIYGDDGSTISGYMVITIGEKVNFSDVKETDYFYDAVVWAVNEGVTNGLSATQFGPNATCTRAQVVTFLWRAAGEPKPTTSYMPFKDVDDDAYYYDAVLWAVEEDITTGTSSTTFSPNATVTRGQVVTFLWRAEGSRSVITVNPFKDVDADDYYYEAVLWAVENDITTGLSATEFGPNSGCTRGQIVTFLYRNYEED